MVNSSPAGLDPEEIMPKELWFILAFIAAVIIYTVAHVRNLMRTSDKQWEQVDKSKLREWEDDD